MDDGGCDDVKVGRREPLELEIAQIREDLDEAGRDRGTEYLTLRQMFVPMQFGTVYIIEKSGGSHKPYEGFESVDRASGTFVEAVTDTLPSGRETCECLPIGDDVHRMTNSSIDLNFKVPVSTALLEPVVKPLGRPGDVHLTPKSTLSLGDVSPMATDAYDAEDYLGRRRHMGDGGEAEYLSQDFERDARDGPLGRTSLTRVDEPSGGRDTRCR